MASAISPTRTRIGMRRGVDEEAPGTHRFEVALRQRRPIGIGQRSDHDIVRPKGTAR